MAGSIFIPLKAIFDDKGIKDAQRQFKKLGGTLQSTLGAVGIGLGLTAMVVGLKDAAKAAAEDAKSQEILANSLRNTVGANDEMIASVEQSISQMQKMAAVADDQIRPAFQTLAAATGSVEEATRLTAIALDLAATKGIPVTSAADKIAKATQGQTTALTRLMPELKGSTDLFGDLAAATQGAAETAAQNDPFQRMNILLGEMQEQIGYGLLPMINNLADTLSTADFAISFSNLAVSIDAAIDQIDILFQRVSGKNAFTTIVDIAGAAAVGIAEIAFWLGDVGTTIGYIISGQWGKAGNQMATYFRRYNAFVQGIYDKQDEAAANIKFGTNTGSSLVTPYNPPTSAVKSGANKTATDFVGEFYAGIEEEASKIRAGNMLSKLGLSPALVQEILGSAEWRKVFINVKNSGTTALTELQASFNKTAKGMQELADIQQELQDAVDARNAEALAQYEEQLALYESQIEAINAFKEALAGVAKGVAPLAVVTRELGSFELATVTAFVNITASIEQGLADGTLLKSAADNLTAYARKEQAIIQSLMRQRDAIVEKRSLAEAMLRDVKDAIVGVGNLTSFLNSTSEKVTETVTKMVGGMQVVISRTIEQVTGTKAVDLVNSFSSILAKTKAFALQLKQLRELGLDKNLYQQIVDAGIDAGGQTAAAILEGGAGTVSELNGLFSELNTVGEQIATQTAEVMYGAGVDLTNGLIAGLISQEQALVDSATTLANAFTEAFNASVSANIVMPVAPTQPIMETLQPVDTGLVTLRLGDIKLGDFGSGSAALATKLIATPQATAWNTSITINTNGVTDGTSLGKLITSELNKYAKNNGITVK